MVDSWLNDNTANRHKQTYIKGFLDISGGDLILRNGQQYVDSSYNYSTTDISDNSITSSEEITDNPVWSQVGNTLSSDYQIYHAAMEASGNVIAYTERTSDTNYYAHVYQYSDVSNEFQKLGSSIQGSHAAGSFYQFGIKLNGVGSRITFACPGATNPVTSEVNAGSVEVHEYNTTVSGDWAQVGSTVYGEDNDRMAEVLGQVGYYGLDFNAKGDIFAVGSAAYSTNTSEGNNAGFQLGRVKVYAYRDGTDSDWTKIGDFIGQNTYTGQMGSCILNDAGTIIATGEGTDGNDNYAGTVRVYEYEGDLSWNQLGGDIDGGASYDMFGRQGLSFNSSGSIISIGGYGSSPGYMRVFEYKTISEEEYNNGNTSSNTGNVGYGGFAPIIVTNGQSWSATTKFWVQLGMDIAGREGNDYFGMVASLNDDGTILSVQATGGHTQMATDHVSADTGPVYVYKYTNNRWMLLGDSIEIVNPLVTLESQGCMLNHDGTKILVGQEGTARLFEISQITNYASNSTYKTTNRTGNYSIRVGDVSNNNTALSITKNYTAVTHDISGTYSDSYTHYPLLGDLHLTASSTAPTSYTQLGLDISVELTGGICKLDASGTRLLTGSNSGINVYEYSHFTWTQLGSTLGLGGSNTGLYQAELSGNGEYVAITGYSNDNTLYIYKYNSSANAWESYGSVSASDGGGFLDIAYDGQTIIVGDIYYNPGGLTNSGRARVVEYTGDGSTHSWTQVGGDIVLDAEAYERNGFDVAINKTGNIIAVGAIGFDDGVLDRGRLQVFKYKSGAEAGNYTPSYGGLYSYDSHTDWEPLGTDIVGPYVQTNQTGLAIQMSDDGYTIVTSSTGGSSSQRYIEVLRYSEELSDWYHYGHGRAENNNDSFAERSRYLEISGDGEMVIAGALLNGNGMVRQYKVLNGKLEPVGPAIAGVSGSYDDLGYVSMSSDGKIVAMGSSVNDNVRVFQLNDVQQTITANTYKNTETETQDYIHLGNKTSGNMLEIKGTSEITGDMTINSTGTYQYIDISHVPQSIVLMDENEVYHTDVSYNGALSGYYCAALSSVYNSTFSARESLQTLIGNNRGDSIRAVSSGNTYSGETYVGSVITSYKESKTDATYTDLSGEYLQIEFPFMIKPNEFNYMIDSIYAQDAVGAVGTPDISYGMLVGWDGTEWLKLTTIQQSDYNLYGVTNYDLSSNTHYINKLRIIAHSTNNNAQIGFGAPYLSGTIRTGTVPSMAITSTDTDIKFNVTDLSMAGNLTIEANTFTLKNKDLNTDSDVNLIKYFPQAVGGNTTIYQTDNADNEMQYSTGGGAMAMMANVIHHTGSNSHFNGGYLFVSSSQYDVGNDYNYAPGSPFMYLSENTYIMSARHFMEQTFSQNDGLVYRSWASYHYRYNSSTGAYLGTNTTTFVDMNGNTHNVGGEYLELHTPLRMKFKKYHYLSNYTHGAETGGTQRIMFVGKKNDIYYQLSYPQTLIEGTFYNSIDLDRTDIFVTSIRIIFLEAYTTRYDFASVSQLSFDAIPSIDTHLEITNNQFGTVFNAYDKGAKGNIILNEAPHFNKWYLQYENTNNLDLNSAAAAERVFSNPTGYVGIGTNKPSAPLTVYGYGGRSSMADTAYTIYHSQSTTSAVTNVGNSVIPVSSTSAYMAPGVYVNHAIRTMNFIIAHGSLLIASDERIKTNVKDIDDGVALETLRALKPKTYEYINKINRSETGHVYGFLAQDVSAALPYSVRLQRDCTPNIYEFADISNGNIVLTRNTTDVFTRVPELDASGNALQDTSGNTIYRLKNKTLKCMTARGDDFEVTIKDIVDDKRFTIKESITVEQRTHIDISRNIIKDKLFIVGEMVDDFHTMKKSAIWTITTAALQEIDRQLEETKEKKIGLQTQITALLAEVEALKNNAS